MAMPTLFLKFFDAIMGRLYDLEKQAKSASRAPGAPFGRSAVVPKLSANLGDFLQNCASTVVRGDLK